MSKPHARAPRQEPTLHRRVIAKYATAEQAERAFKALWSIEGLHRPGRLGDAAQRGGLDLYLAAEVRDGPEAKEAVSAFTRTQAVLCYAEGAPTPPPDDEVGPGVQRHLFEAPVGVGVRGLPPQAWKLPGGLGENVSIIDIEQGWGLKHQDFDDRAPIRLLGGLNLEHRRHGTRVIGVIGGDRSGEGTWGIAPRARLGLISQWRAASLASADRAVVYQTAEAILEAAGWLSPGDVLVLQAQVTLSSPWRLDPQRLPMLPVEVEPLVRDAIREAVARDIVVVAAAGNGGHDLDEVCIDGEYPLRRSRLDSQAIVVGASTASAPHRRIRQSNYGSRVDCYAHGYHVATSTTDELNSTTDEYTTSFSGTSAATAIVAGVAAVVQSWVHARFDGRRLRPQAMRRLLRDVTFGTRSHTPSVDRIGVMPDLGALWAHLPERSALWTSRDLTEPVAAPPSADG